MKRPDIYIVLYGASGDKERWKIQWRPMKKGHYGECDWERREITINSRLRNTDTIRATLLHECSHVACGRNGSEELIVSIEENFESARKALVIS